MLVGKAFLNLFWAAQLWRENAHRCGSPPQLQMAGGFNSTCPGDCTSPSYCWENKQLERAKRSAEKSLTLALYQTPEDPMAPMFNYFHCSQDNLTFAFLQCLEANKFRTSLYEAAHEHRSHPQRVCSSVEQPKHSPWHPEPLLSLGMPPLPSARVRISSPVASGGHSFPTHQHNCFLRKVRFSKWGGITEKTLKVARNNQGLQMHCCPELTAFQTDSIKTWRWKEHWKIKSKSDQVFPLTSTLTFLVFLSFAHL